ncbi:MULTISPECIES: sigma-70 family RNA polymerase sigma factor [Staphylococcus]|uniref:sigma-70 family RNA polymerase sigma factor n=1 Tax=Staphylococcus TaxID=1279 RepID=UPI000AE95A09|nr:sigma-70 family RNA polymerase sigma factor [Staphylococcus shinii]MEC5302220.1 sigma-70 family RNA polymerase sigma factor [Staphylococcus shinii]
MYRKKDDVNACNNDLRDFFKLNNPVETDFYDDNNIEDVILYNELEAIVEKVGTDKEHYIFWLLSEGYSYKEIGKVFYITEARVKQIFDGLLSKLA